MKKISIIGLAFLLSACASNEYTTEVTSESHREEFQPVVSQPVVSSSGVTATDIAEESVKVVKMSPPADKKTVKLAPKSKTKPAVQITPPSKKVFEQPPRYGYTIQVVAVGAREKVTSFSVQLPNDGQPVWEHYKVVNGTKWYSVLYGDFATRAEAKKAISSLPSSFSSLQPFVKSIDSIKNSDYPDLNKLN